MRRRTACLSVSADILRPTHAHIERLQEELRQLKGPPAAGSSETEEAISRTPRQDKEAATAREYDDTATATPSSTVRSDVMPGRYMTVSHGAQSPPANPPTPCGPSTYHGPTSASHDGAVHERRPQQWFTAEREALMPNLLFAAAARQRMSGAVIFDVRRGTLLTIYSRTNGKAECQPGLRRR